MPLDRSKALIVRQLTDAILIRAPFLDAPERTLLQQVFARGIRPHEIAAVSERSPRTIQRRVRQLVERLTDETVLHFIRNHHKWAPDTAAVALALWVRGHSYRQAAADLNLTLHQIRQLAAAVRALTAGAKFSADDPTPKLNRRRIRLAAAVV